jgi:protein-S-isoprenylcysteine O-methyltransferase Ste14
MGACFSLVYGLVVYAFFLATFLYAIAFTGDLFVPKSIDAGATVSLAEALIVNLLLLGLFAVQHSVMARRSFKRWWTRIVPPAVERSTYVLAATLALAFLLWQWRPIPEPVIWRIEDGVASRSIWFVFWLGWGVLLVSTFLINHFELFGLGKSSHAWRAARCRGRSSVRRSSTVTYAIRSISALWSDSGRRRS